MDNMKLIQTQVYISDWHEFAADAVSGAAMGLILATAHIWLNILWGV